MKDINSAAKDIFGISEFRPGQLEVIDAVMAGRSVMFRAATGLGKSLCYQLPAALSEGITVVVSPLIALMRNQVSNLNGRISAGALHSQLEEVDRTHLLDQAQNGDLNLLFLSPEQLQRQVFARIAEATKIDRLAIDEAHCVYQWGGDFRPDYASIGRAADKFGIKQRMGLTATISRKVATEVKASLGIQDSLDYFGQLHRDNLSYEVVPASSPKEKALLLLRKIREHVKAHEPVLVYCATRQDVVKLADYLKINGINAQYYHGAMDPKDREIIEEEFIKNRVPVMVATNAFGMGVDKGDIGLIAHFGLPGSVAAYLQETGRAGRNGQPAECVLFYDERDSKIQQLFLRDQNPDLQIVRSVYGGICRELQSRKVKRGNSTTFDFEHKLKGCFHRQDLAQDTKLKAALAALQVSGAIAIMGEEIMIVGDLDSDQVGEFLERKKALSLSKLDQMVSYAQNPDGGQSKLIEILEA